MGKNDITGLFLCLKNKYTKLKYTIKMQRHEMKITLALDTKHKRQQTKLFAI